MTEESDCLKLNYSKVIIRQTFLGENCFVDNLGLIIRRNEELIVKKHKKICIYLMTISFITFLSFVFFCIFRGTGFEQIFIPDSYDTFMDHFNVVSKYTSDDPYKIYLNSYPAFVCFIWEIFAHIIPIEYRYSLSSFELRENQYAMMPFIVFILLCFWLFTLCIKIRFELDNITESFLILAILLSSPMLFTLERGNIIILAFVFTAFFVFFRNSENKVIREAAYISLAMASAIKIYPAILGLMMIKEKNFKGAIRLLIYGLITFFVPFFACFEGITSIKYMIQGLTVVSGYDIGCGYQYSFSNMISIFSRVFGVDISNGIIYSTSIVINACIIISFFRMEEEWKQILALTLPMILLPGFSYTYVLIFLFIPFVLLIGRIYTQESIGFENKIYLILFGVIFTPTLTMPIPLFTNDQYVLTYGMLVDNFALICITCLLFRDAIKRKHRSK